MKKFIFILLCWAISNIGEGQNLVPNYSFEFFTSCPTSGGQLSNAIPWVALPALDVEYFNSCAPPCDRSVPCQNLISFQYANTGNAIAAFWMLNGYGGNYREYLQVQLIDSLINSNCYYVSFYVNLQNPVGLAVNNFGAHLSTSSYSTSGSPAPYIPQVLSYGNKIINDTLNWHLIQGIYFAYGGEKYLTIGNFFDDLSTDTLHTGNGTYPGAYYYIDDVSVIPIDSILGSMSANAGNDTTIINGDSAFVGQEISNLYCNWYIGAALIADSVSGLYVSPIVNTTYIVEQNLCGNITYDTVTVYVSGVGINENDWSSKITLFPNPSTNIVNIEGENISSVIIYDVNGRVLIQTQQKQIDISALAKGVYSVVITSDKNKIVKKMVKM